MEIATPEVCFRIHADGTEPQERGFEKCYSHEPPKITYHPWLASDDYEDWVACYRKGREVALKQVQELVRVVLEADQIAKPISLMGWFDCVIALAREMKL